MKKHVLFTLIVTIIMVVLIGVHIFQTMTNELELHPEIKDIGGPPVYDLRLLLLVVIGLVAFVSIVIKLESKEGGLFYVEKKK